MDMNKEREKGLIHIYAGDGKGKTTAAVGLSVRCAGAGGKVLFFQFLKDGSSSEIAILKTIPGIDVVDPIANTKFVFQMNEEEKKEYAKRCSDKLKELQEHIKKNNYDMIILDEVIHVVNYDFIQVSELLSFIEKRPYNTELILTGRNPKAALLEVADYVTEMAKIKHPYDNGIPARTMIEY